MELRDGVAVVTGGGGGLGEVVVERLGAEGAVVLVADVDEAGATRVGERVRRAGGRAEPVVADLSDPAAVETVAAVAEHLGGVRLLVNNAGGWVGEPGYPAAPVEQWRRGLDLNLTVPMLLLQRLLPALVREGGAVVNVASSAGWEDGGYAHPEYAVAKAGLVRLTTALADLGEAGVRVSCVVPGWIGLPRAERERAALPAEAAPPALVPPALLADTVVALARDEGSAGRVLLALEGEEVTPAAMR